MRKRIVFVIGVLLILAGIFIIIKVLASVISPQGKGALQINTNIKADIFLNGKNIGVSPLCKCGQNDTLPSGEYLIKIVPIDKDVPEYVVKTSIKPGVLTAVEKTFLPESLGSSYVLTLEKTSIKTPQLYISSIPDNAIISVDGLTNGATPLLVKDISASEHELELQKQGFAKKTIRIRTVPFYKLNVMAILGTEGNENYVSPSVVPTASPSAALKLLVKIKNTPTGFLRVRENPSLSGTEITRVKPGETFPFIDEQTSWYQIQLTNGSKGWISSDYSEKVTQ